MEEKGKYLKRRLKNLGRVVVGSGELLGAVVSVYTLPAIGVPLLIDGAFRFAKGIRGEYIKDSMINVVSNKRYSEFTGGKKNKIIQEKPSIGQLVAASLTKNKMNFLLMQELNFLLASDTFDKKGERIKYNTNSQALTKLMLSRLQKAGFIKELEVTADKSRPLIMEKVIMGNVKGLLKEEKMFDMSFSKTDVKITEQDIKNILKIDSLDEVKYVVKRDKENNILSINYRVSNLIKEKLIDVKNSFMPSNKLLPEATKQEESDLNKKENIVSEKNELSSLSVLTVNPQDIKSTSNIEKVSTKLQELSR